MSTYTKPTISNYNDNPPTNDGSTNFVDNGVDWDLHINEIGDPLKNFEESEATATESAFSDLQDISAINVQDPDYGATGDGTTDDSTAIQLAISAAEAVPGQTILFPPGAYNLGTTGITILGDGIILEGLSPRFVGASLFGVEFLYSGTGTAVTFGSSAKVAHYRNQLNNIQIRATGSATSSATAIGLKLTNEHYFDSSSVAIKDFSSGIGLKLTAAGSGGFGATNQFRALLIHVPKIGIQSTGAGGGILDNHTTFFGGALLQTGTPSGSIGLDLQENSDGYIFYGMDIEGFEIGAKVAGDSHRFFGCRTEFNTLSFQVESTAARTELYGTQFSGSLAISDQITDAGALTIRIDNYGIFNPPAITPFTDKGQLLHVMKADQTTSVFNVSTNGTPRVDMANGFPLHGYSDAFSTLTYRLLADTGLIRAKIFHADGTPISVAAGEISVGGDVSGSASAGSATLPANPLGFIDAFVAGTPVRIPYYAI